MYFGAWRLPHHSPSLSYSFIQWENQTGIPDTSQLPPSPYIDFVLYPTALKEVLSLICPTNATNEKRTAEETNTFSSLKCHLYLCCKKR